MHLGSNESVRANKECQEFRCEWQSCNKSFQNRYALLAHQRIHTGQRPYPCGDALCNKAFKTASDLRRHLRVHTGEKPYECSVPGCYMRFSTHTIRKVHLRTHTGDRPYACDHPGCTMTFSSKTNWRNHARTHTGEKPFVCKHTGCGRRFAEYSTWYKHQTVHVPGSLLCAACGRRFKQLNVFREHVSRDHAGLQLDGFETGSVGDSSVTVKAISSLLPEPLKEGTAGTASTSNTPELPAAELSDTISVTAAGESALEDAESSATMGGATGGGQKFRVLLTSLDMTTVEIDGQPTSVLLLPDKVKAEIANGSAAKLELIPCPETLVITSEVEGEQIVLEGEVPLPGEAPGDILVDGLVDQGVEVIGLREEAVGDSVRSVESDVAVRWEEGGLVEVEADDAGSQIVKEETGLDVLVKDEVDTKRAMGGGVHMVAEHLSE